MTRPQYPRHEPSGQLQAASPKGNSRFSGRRLAVLLTSLVLGACSGIPLSSLPRLMNLQQELLETRPAEFMFAVQTDDRVIPRSDAVPSLDIAFKPEEGSGLQAMTRKLPMRLVVQDRPAGLTPSPAGRRWMVYSLTLESQLEMARQQASYKAQLAARKSGADGKKGGTLTVGISQEGIAVDDPRLAYTQWSSWLQTSGHSGYFELWSGTIADLKAQEKRAARDKAR